MSEVVLQQILTLATLKLAEHFMSKYIVKASQFMNLPPLWVTIPIMPCDGAFFNFNVASSRTLWCRRDVSYSRGGRYEIYLSVVFEDFVNFIHPVHVQICCEVRPLILPRFSNKATMLRRHAKLLEMREVLLQKVLITARNNVDEVFRIVR